MEKEKKRWIPKNSFEAIVGEDNVNKMGHYDEYVGGGTPLKKGQSFQTVDTVEEAHAIREQDPSAKVRVNQPRDEDGQFTYNSANHRELEYGPSRGKTLPPFLKGVNLNFVDKKKGKVVVLQDDIKYLAEVRMNEAQFVEACKRYLSAEGGFKGLTKKIKGKKGARSKIEQEYYDKGISGVVSSVRTDAVHQTAYIEKMKQLVNAYGSRNRELFEKMLVGRPKWSESTPNGNINPDGTPQIESNVHGKLNGKVVSDSTKMAHFDGAPTLSRGAKKQLDGFTPKPTRVRTVGGIHNPPSSKLNKEEEDGVIARLKAKGWEI